ncbi:hypothetical protein FJZ53_03635 [Candidatus Woesearchaeota archaeon]|nr:hypothetical protein [Candidatus Woesearchaeota archaeon]
MNLKKIEDRIKKLMEKEDRKDVEFRYIIAMSEVGDVGKYISHDSKLNPNARPHGSKDDEILAYGQAFIQLMALAHLRDVSVKEAFEKGMQNWESADWKKVAEKSIEKILGKPACVGSAKGLAYVVNEYNKIENFKEGQILVAEFTKPDIMLYAKKASAIVTDHGSTVCHAAVVAREYNIPCVVGTGNATKSIKHGQLIFVDAEKGEVKILE